MQTGTAMTLTSNITGLRAQRRADHFERRTDANSYREGQVAAARYVGDYVGGNMSDAEFLECITGVGTDTPFGDGFWTTMHRLDDALRPAGA